MVNRCWGWQGSCGSIIRMSGQRGPSRIAGERHTETRVRRSTLAGLMMDHNNPQAAIPCWSHPQTLYSMPSEDFTSGCEATSNTTTRQIGTGAYQQAVDSEPDPGGTFDGTGPIAVRAGNRPSRCTRGNIEETRGSEPEGHNHLREYFPRDLRRSVPGFDKAEEQIFVAKKMAPRATWKSFTTTKPQCTEAESTTMKRLRVFPMRYGGRSEKQRIGVSRRAPD